jgi:hypothetical protein
MNAPTDTDAFSPITLTDMEAAGLHRRMETKYLLPQALLRELLEALEQHYYALEIEGARRFHYQTVYYDTADFKCYLAHHNDAAMRIKVRERFYGHTGETYFEIKQKRHDGRIHKIRRLVGSLSGDVQDKAKSLVEHPLLHAYNLEHSLTTAYDRLTLCAYSMRERVTIDQDIQLIASDGLAYTLEGVVIVEVKQSHIDHSSLAMRWLKGRHILPTPFSKYVTGIALHHPYLKRNNFKPQLLRLQQLSHA